MTLGHGGLALGGGKANWIEYDPDGILTRSNFT
jgi:hypothetical protein